MKKKNNHTAEASDPFAQHPIIETDVIKIKSLTLDAGTQPRVGLNDETIRNYTDVIVQALNDGQPNPFDLLADENLPQVFRDPGSEKLIPADGFHRIASHKAAHVNEIRVALREGDNRAAMVYAAGANATHGVQRTNKDRQRAVSIFLQDPEWCKLSNVQIARLAAVSEATVRSQRDATKAPSERSFTHKSGKKTTMKTGNIGKGSEEPELEKPKGKRGRPKKGQELATPATEEAPKEPQADTEIDTLLRKIADAVGGTEGGKIRKAVHDGALVLSPRDVRDWAGMAPKYIKSIAPLVTGDGGRRMKPGKAFDFLTQPLSPRIVAELHNKAIGSPQGIYIFEEEGIKITVTHIKRK